MIKKSIYLLALLTISSALYAQEDVLLGKEELLAAFEKYNPSVLDNAARNDAYASIVNQLLDSYSAPRNEQNELELIALAKNFDNSIVLYLLREQYLRGRLLQEVTPTSLPSLEEGTRSQLILVLQRMFANTVEVKEIELARQQQVLKQIRQDKNLSAAQKREHIQKTKAQIKQIKQNLREFKANSKQKIYATAQLQLEQFQAIYESARAEQLAAWQANTPDIKSNPQKSAAQ